MPRGSHPIDQVHETRRQDERAGVCYPVYLGLSDPRRASQRYKTGLGVASIVLSFINCSLLPPSYASPHGSTPTTLTCPVPHTPINHSHSFHQTHNAIMLSFKTLIALLPIISSVYAAPLDEGMAKRCTYEISTYADVAKAISSKCAVISECLRRIRGLG
jgi:hypothetical protein